VTATGLVLHRSPDSVRLITSDISRFWRAVDDAAGRDSAARVQIWRQDYLGPASVGLRDFVRLRLVTGRGDTTSQARSDSALADAAAVQFASVTAKWPRYFASIRTTTLAVDTSTQVTDMVRSGLRRLSALYRMARYPDVYFVVGRLTTGGTTSPNGLLIGVEVFSGGTQTPVDELPPGERLAATVVSPGVKLGPLVVHEAVHFLQEPWNPDPGRATLLRQVLLEGGANFVAELVTVPFTDQLLYQRYGDAHQQELWPAFREEMHGTDAHRWLGNYTVADNHGAPDLGYWVGYRIAAAYYARARDKQAAVRDLIVLTDPERIWRQSGYASVLR
jgi:hypothetical protein